MQNKIILPRRKVHMTSPLGFLALRPPTVPACSTVNLQKQELEIGKNKNKTFKSDLELQIELGYPVARKLLVMIKCGKGVR